MGEDKDRSALFIGMLSGNGLAELKGGENS